MKVANEAVQEAGMVSEGTICYTGDILNAERSNIYTLDYYVKMAKELEREGFHILAIKDMAGLLKPKAAYELMVNYVWQHIFQFIYIHMILVEMDC